jgi:hypothetical protein
MVTHPTLDQRQTLRLSGRSQARMAQRTMPDIDRVSCDERLGVLVDRERTARDSKRLKTRLYKAKLRQASCIEESNYRHPRG